MQPQNATGSQEGADHRRSLANRDRPAIDAPVPQIVQDPSHHLHLPPAPSLQHLAREDPPPEGSSVARRFEAIFDSTFNAMQY